MRYYDVITTVNTSVRGRKLPSGAQWPTNCDYGIESMSHADLKHFIAALREIAEVPPVWTTFKNSRGQVIEKCVFEWYPGAGVRCTDVVWVNKGYDYLNR